MRKFTGRAFYGGMNNVAPVHQIPDDQAEQILNLYLRADGVWKDIGTPAELLDLSEVFFANAVKVYQWKPSKVPDDCVDDFVYIVFYDDGDCKMVYRGETSGTPYTLGVKARLFGTSTYIAIGVTSITVDIDGEATSDTTATNPAVSFTRRYYEGSTINMTAAADNGAGTAFYRWVDGSGNVLSFDRVLEHIVTGTLTIIAEYTAVPFIRIEDALGVAVSLTEFYAQAGETSEVQSYFVGGLFLESDLYIYPPEDFEISLDETTWVANPSSIRIAFATANAAMTEIFVRFAPAEA